ncbi:DUF4595 domain-containing protein [Dysgonomonas massiliensis]|uniref:DUF4595 domain-containing protein n=1 Tax=Dysgonomonas massiliensis TaxID=2040292 RepID=UPI000C77A471|nr:DUF4595 domain-containing protein [Dysgonomonas massiliensis]
MKYLLALFTVVMLFTACSDDEDNSNIGYPSKTLKQVDIFNEEDHLIKSIYLYYNDKGQWIKSKYEEYEETYIYTYNTTLSYTDDKILYTSTSEHWDGGTVEFAIKENRIITATRFGDVDYYTYSDGYLSQIGSSDKVYDRFEYTNGNLTRSFNVDEGSLNLKYTNTPDRLGINIIGYYTDTFDPASPLYQFGYFGKRSKNLIKSIGKTNYSYTLDNEGYVTEIKIEYGSGAIRIYKLYYNSEG